MDYREMIVVNASDIELEVKRQFDVEIDAFELFWGGWEITSPYMPLYFAEQETYYGFDDAEAEDIRLRNLVRVILQDKFGHLWDEVIVDVES